MDFKNKKQILIKEFNENQQVLQQLTNKQQQIIGQLNFIDEIEKEEEEFEKNTKSQLESHLANKK